jgi:glycosyltransferase involved in cell wall biosynthesis
LKEILIAMKGPFERAVPIISISQAFKSLGINVTVVCSSYEPAAKQNLLSMGIDIVELMPELHERGRDYLKIKHWSLFRMRFWSYIRKRNPFIYVGSGDTAICLGKKLINYQYFLHLRELYVENPLYLRLLRKYASNSVKNITPEINRAFIYRVLWKLSDTPYVIPNKPYFHPRNRNIDLGGIDKNQISGLKSKIILYQGLIQHSERDLMSLVKAVKEHKEYTLVLMGKDYNYLEKLLKINSSIIHIPYLPTPNHLIITSHAHIGIVTYTYLSLNTIYCAPNKTWEYSGFGIPMLGNKIPGLINTIGNFRLGSLVEMDDSESIIKGIQNIEENYETYRRNAMQYYESVDIPDLIQGLIN